MGKVLSSFPGVGSSLRSRNDVVDVSSATGAGVVVASSCSVTVGAGAVAVAVRLNLPLKKDKHWPISMTMRGVVAGGRTGGDVMWQV